MYCILQSSHLCSFVHVQVVSKDEAGQEIASSLEECKVGRKKSEEEVMTWKKELVSVRVQRALHVHTCKHVCAHRHA